MEYRENMGHKSGGGGILKAMQSPVDYASNYRDSLKEKAEQDRVQAEKEKRDAEFFTELRVRREKAKAEFQKKRRADQEKLKAETVPLKPIPELPPALIRGEPHDPGAPALINPTPALRERVRGLGTVDDKGVLGFGLLGIVRKRLGIL